MQVLQACCGFLLSLIVPALLWGQAMPAPIVEPPRQQMQTVAPNVRIGPYLMNVTGKTFVNDVFLDVALTANGQPVPDGTSVTLDAVPPKDDAPSLGGGTPAPPSGTPAHLTAVTKAGHAKLVPPLDVEGDWSLAMMVTGPAGNGTTTASLKMGVDPHSPPASLNYRLSQLAIPIVTVVLLLAFFRLRRIELERRPSDRAHAGAQLGSASQ